MIPKTFRVRICDLLKIDFETPYHPSRLIVMKDDFDRVLNERDKYKKALEEYANEKNYEYGEFVLDEVYAWNFAKEILASSLRDKK